MYGNRLVKSALVLTVLALWGLTAPPAAHAVEEDEKCPKSLMSQIMALGATTIQINVQDVAVDAQPDGQFNVTWTIPSSNPAASIVNGYCIKQAHASRDDDKIRCTTGLTTPPTSGSADSCFAGDRDCVGGTHKFQVALGSDCPVVKSNYNPTEPVSAESTYSGP